MGTKLNWTQVLCTRCGEIIETQRDAFVAEKLLGDKLKYWHNNVENPTEDCWRTHFQPEP